MQALHVPGVAGNRSAFNDLIAEDVRWHSVARPELPWAGLRQGREAVYEYFPILMRDTVVEGCTLDHAIGNFARLQHIGFRHHRQLIVEGPAGYDRIDLCHLGHRHSNPHVHNGRVARRHLRHRQDSRRRWLAAGGTGAVGALFIGFAGKLASASLN